MKKKLHLFLLLICTLRSFAQGNYVFTGAEAVNFGSISLSTPGGQTWATNRSSPGYFGAVNGTAFTGASNANNVNGYVKKYGNQAFTFPVGTGTELRTLSISAPSSVSDAFATAWIAGDPNGNIDPTMPNSGAHSRSSLGAGIISVSPVGEWDWQDFNNDGAGLTVTVSIPDMTSFALTPNLRLVGWNGGLWLDLSGAATASGNTAGSTLSGTMVNGITAIGIASTTWVLDITLTAFAVVPQECNASLTWATTNENGNTYFDIEQSTNGVSFVKIGGLAAKYDGNGGEYLFTASQNSGAVFFYRLKIVNSDGSFTYSAIRRLSTRCGNTGNYMELSPNPVVTGSGQVRLRFKADYRGKATLMVINNLGQQLLSRQTTIVDGDNICAFNTGSMEAGTYYVRLTDAKGNSIGATQKLIKQ